MELRVYQVRVLKKGEGRQLIHAGLNESHKEYHYVLTQVWHSFSSVLTLLQLTMLVALLTQSGRSYAESVNVSYQLSPSCPNGGGLILVYASTVA